MESWLKTATIILLFSMVFAKSAPQDVLGPGGDALIMRSEDFSNEELPMEHRGTGLMLPDVFAIPRSVTSELNVDLFFSLFFVFLNNDWTTSKEEATILAPVGLNSSEAARWLSAEEGLTEELLLSHILIGQQIRPELLVEPIIKTTISGMEVVFSLEDTGDILVNNVKVVAMENYENILIIVLEDYLFKDELSSELTEYISEFEDDIFVDDVPRVMSVNGKLVPTPRNGEKNCTNVSAESEFSIFKTITVCSETIPDENSVETRNEDRAVQKPGQGSAGSSPTSPGIIDQIATITAFFRGPGLNDFIEYARQLGLNERLQKDQAFTVLAPVDEAFRKWYPIDWGFNPFDVDEFVNETLTNHVVPGVIDLNSVQDLSEQKTLGGKTIVFSKNPETVFINSVQTLGEIDLLVGKVIFLKEVLFLNNTITEELNKKYGYLETGPLITFPWVKSQFLSHALSILETTPEFSYMAEYMNITSNLGDYAQGYYDSERAEGYTLFVPRDDAFWKILLADAAAPDPFIQKADFRLEMLIGHLAVGRYFRSDLSEDSNISTLAERNLTVHSNSTGVWLYDGKKFSMVLDEPIYVYNLGIIIPIDSVLFVETSDVISAIESLEVDKDDSTVANVSEENSITDEPRIEDASTEVNVIDDIATALPAKKDSPKIDKIVKLNTTNKFDDRIKNMQERQDDDKSTENTAKSDIIFNDNVGNSPANEETNETITKYVELKDEKHNNSSSINEKMFKNEEKYETKDGDISNIKVEAPQTTLVYEDIELEINEDSTRDNIIPLDKLYSDKTFLEKDQKLEERKPQKELRRIDDEVNFLSDLFKFDLKSSNPYSTIIPGQRPVNPVNLDSVQFPRAEKDDKQTRKKTKVIYVNNTRIEIEL